MNNMSKSQVLKNGKTNLLADYQSLNNPNDPLTLSMNNEMSKPKLKTLVIPYIIKQIYPTMSLTDYSNVKEDKAFLNQTTFVCEECFLCVTMSSECSGVKIIIPPQPSQILAQKKRELSQ
jgi:hypothetical protein